MSSRSYLSIGDVLTLLRQEFPDVTISKIRFLESQGLVNPERTPSGYRKFYEQDVERLRWVLRQQRENFLPLKVIKDRLDDDANGAGDEEVVPARHESQATAADKEPAWRSGSAGRGEPVLVGQRSASQAGASGTATPAAGATTRAGTALPGIEGVGSASRSTGVPAASHAEPPAVGAARSAVGERVPPQQPSETPPPPATETATAKRPASRSSRTGTDPTPAGDTATRRSGGGPTGAAPAEGSPPGAAPRSDVGAASLSLEELSAACGLDEDVLRELQEYGLLTATPVAGLDYFDQDALAVATAAAALARFGVEPRHLRLYKNAADREAGFVEQIVLPLVRQRNPDARARAHQTADELAGLGQQMRASLLRVALRGLLDG